MKIRCWLWGRRETEQEIEVDDPDFAPDNYAAKFNRCDEGDISFVETDRGELWRVECLMGRPLVMLRVQRCTEDEAREEIAKATD